MLRNNGRHNFRSPFGIQPSFVLDFAGTGTLDPSVTFTRSTTGTYYNSSGVLTTAAINEARFDYNPSTLAPLGLLIEESSTNLILQSGQIQTSPWTNVFTTSVGNNIVAPDGTTSGTKINEAAQNSVHIVIQGITASATAYTATADLKAAERTWGTLQLDIAGTNPTYFDLVNGQVGNLGTGTTATITNAGDGWWRCSVTRTLTAGGWYFCIGTATANGTSSFVGDVTKGIYAWGAQLEAVAFPTSYIPTTSAQVTRASDNASMTGTNFSSWYNQGQGTLYAEAFSTNNVTNASDGIAKGIINISDGTNNNNITLAWQGTRYFVNTNNVTIILNTVGTFTANTSFKFVGSYISGSNYSFARDGVLGTSVTSGLAPTVNQLNIGRCLPALGIFSGTIKKFAYYPQALTSDQLQALTGS